LHAGIRRQRRQKAALLLHDGDQVVLGRQLAIADEEEVAPSHHVFDLQPVLDIGSGN
jgi:hypothetical protein